jgi:hypothetical protein
MFEIFKNKQSLKTYSDNQFNGNVNRWIYRRVICVSLILISLAGLGLNTYYQLKTDSKSNKNPDVGYELIKSVHNFVGNIQKRKLVIIQGDIMEPIFYDGDQACLDIEAKSYRVGNVIIYQGATENDIFIRKIAALPGSIVEFQNAEVALASDEFFVEINNFSSKSEYKQAIVNKNNILGKIINEIDSTMGSIKCLAKY